MQEERRIVNKVIIISWNVVATILVLAYLLEVIKGERTIPYFLVACALGGIPLIMGNVQYKKDPSPEKLKYLTAYGYSFFYLFILLTSDTCMSFVYIFPMLSAFVVCNDYKLLRRMGIISIVGNIVSIAVRVFTTPSIKLAVP